MTIKIQCACGLKYALDVTAQHLNNPIRFVCNQCGADNSAAINQIVRQQFATAQPVTVCHRHSDQPATENCLVCKKPICPQCMELFGYVCSAYCAGQAERAGVQLPVYEFQKSVVERKFWKKVRTAIAIVLALLGIVVAGMFWYNFAGSRPKAAFAVKFPDKREDGFCRFISAEQVLVRHGNKLARYDVSRKKEVWSAQLIDPKVIEEAAEKWVDAHQFHAENAKVRLAQLKAKGIPIDDLKDHDERPKSDAEQLADAREMIENMLMSQIRLHVEGMDIWVGYTNRIAHVDWNSGAMDKEIPLSGELRRFSPQGSSLMALCDAPLGEKILTHVRLPVGEAQTAALKPAASTNGAKMKLPSIDIPLRAMSVHVRPDFVDDEADRYLNSAVGTYFVNSGPNVAEMKVAMIEQKITQQRTLKEQKKSVLDGAITADKSAELANEIFNTMQEQNTGGVRFEDESRYAVTIRRKLAAGTVPDWAGEVTGPPQLFPLKTVDVLAAGKTVIVLDKLNQRRWDTKVMSPLSAAMTLRGGGGGSALGAAGWMLGGGGGQAMGRAGWGFDDDSSGFTPCVERGNTLFIFDEGVLAAFDIATGNARWRLPSVGVSELKFDSEGMMYIVTTSASQEQLRFRDQVDVTRKTVPVMMKVDPRNGKIIWTLNQTGETCVFSGKYFYSFEAFTGGGRRFGKEVPAYVRIYRLHPSDGRVIWDHVEKEDLVSIDFRDNRIVALFPNELKVLKFLSL